MPAVNLAVDGGNSKTEAIVFDDAGRLLARRTGPGSGRGPAHLADVVGGIIAQLPAAARDIRTAVVAAAGIDFPDDERASERALAGVLPGASRIRAVGDARAILSAAGAELQATVIVCGAGLNAVARGELGVATAPALGWASGDWGGGDALGREAVRIGYRSWDGRGPTSELQHSVLEATGCRDFESLARALRDGRIDHAAVGRLAPLVTEAAARGDAPAIETVARAADFAVSLALEVTARAWSGPVPPGTAALLVGGMFASALYRTEVAARLADAGLAAARFPSRPVLGAVREACALAGLDDSAGDAVDAAMGPA